MRYLDIGLDNVAFEIVGETDNCTLTYNGVDCITFTPNGALFAGQVEFQDNVTLTGDGTVWDDIQNALIGSRLSSPSGTVDYNYAENSVTFQPGGAIATEADRVALSIQLPHQIKLGSTMKFHLHFEQADATVRTFTYRYRIQTQGEAKVTDWTSGTATTDNAVFAYASGTINNILPVASIVLPSTGISQVVQIQFTRTDSELGDVDLTFADAHIEKDSFGSNTEYTK
jgi:hypothetical protein